MAEAPRDIRSHPLVRRFSLYGFLKNQQYFEPFLILAFLDKDLSFFVIGLLIAFRELVANLLEIPSGAVADVFGRRRSMMLSFIAYITSFVIFGFATRVALLFAAMFFFAVGEAFRTGTHKAMIFTWLRSKGRSDARTLVYGYTRSWAKIGSALSVVLAAVFVFASRSYVSIFFFAIIPYVIGIVNFLRYPRDVEAERSADRSLGAVAGHLFSSIKVSLINADLRRLMLESMGFQGFFKAARVYLQPVLKAAAVAALSGLVISERLTEPQQAALLVGPVFFVLYLASALASRHAHRLVHRGGSEQRTARLMWILSFAAFAALLPAMLWTIHAAIIACFIFLEILQNLWRPVYLTRFDAAGPDSRAATTLSVESQARGLTTMILAPLLGKAVDLVRAHHLAGDYWPVAALGLAIALVFLVARPPRSDQH